MVDQHPGWTLNKRQLPDLLALWQEYEIWGPREQQGEVRYQPLNGNQVELQHFNSKRPPKEAFFPQTERMFDFQLEKGQVVSVSRPPLEHRKILILGARPCDARAMTSLDRLFNWDYVDPYYGDRREGALVVAQGCTQPRPSCFCTSVGGDPHGTDGTDLLWTDLGDLYHIQAHTPAGEALAAKAKALLKPPDTSRRVELKRIQEAARQAISRTFETEGLQAALKEHFEHPYWEEVASRCLGCGICTLLCPTCHCFDINDITNHGQMWRERTWDTCQFAYYSIHASGHNPRPAQRERQRNRILHKFLYMDERIEGPGCVGCGRCVAHCPENIDIVESIVTIKEATPHG